MNSGGDERYGCPGVVPVEGGLYACGLLLGHAGPCTPFVGDYLPPLILHPLAPLHSCPACGQRCRPMRGEPVLVLRHFEDGQWVAAETEVAWLFEPCGHQAREILAAG